MKDFEREVKLNIDEESGSQGRSIQGIIIKLFILNNRFKISV